MADKNEIFNFTLNTRGLPDFCVLNENSESDVTIVANYLNTFINRKEKKAAQRLFQKHATNCSINFRKDTALIEFYLDPCFRRALFWDIFLEKISDCRPCINSDWSFEYSVITKALTRFSGPEDENDVEINIDIDHIKEQIHPEYVASINISDKKVDALIRLWGVIEHKLTDVKGQKDQEFYAALIFSYATLFGPSFFEMGVNAVPKLLVYFSSLTNPPETPHEKESESPSEHHSNKTGQELTEEKNEQDHFPDDLEECLTQLKKHSSQLELSTLSSGQLEYLSELALHTQELATQSASSEVFLRISAAIFNFLLDLARKASIEGMKDEDFSDLVARAWEKHLGDNESSIFGEWKIESLLETVSGEIMDASEARKSAQDHAAEIEVALKYINDQEPCGYLETKEREDEIVEIEGAATEAKKELRLANNTLDQAILPPSIDFGNLKDNAVVLERFPSLAESVTERIDSLLLKLKSPDAEEASPPTDSDVDEEAVISEGEVVEPEVSSESEVADEAESEIVEEPEPVTEPEEVQEPEPVTEPEEVQEPEPVTEPEEVQEPEPVTEPEEVQESEPIVEVEPAPVIEPEVVCDSWGAAKSATNLAKDILAEFDKRGVLSSENMNALAFHCLAKDYINIAHKVADAGEMCEFPEDLIAPQLLEKRPPSD